MAMGRKKSPIWRFFTVTEDSRFAKCNKCEINVPRGGQSTKTFTPTNLIHHLKTKPGHEEEYEKYNKLKKENDAKAESAVTTTNDGTRLRQVSLQGSVELRKIWDINDSRAKRIHSKVGEMIAIDCQPVSIVDHEGFKSLVSTLEPKYQLPSRKYFSETVIPSIATKIRASIASQLRKGVEYVSFTSDAWSSDVNSDALLGFTAHWVDSDFHRQSAVLHAQELSERHTGEYIAMKINKMLEEWKIALSQVHVVIRDNGSNMVKAMTEANLPSFGCFAHSLQLVVNDGILCQRGVRDLLAICRSIVGHFRHSSVACHKLAQIQIFLSTS